MTKHFMKYRVILSLLIAVLGWACSEQEEQESISLQLSQKSNTNIRTYQEALEIAQQSIKMIDSQIPTRSKYNNREIDLTNIKVFKATGLTRGLFNGNDTLIYIFNFENNEGFALVSASKSGDALLAVTEKGHCEPDVPSDIEGFNLFIEMAKDYVVKSLETPYTEPNNSSISINSVTIRDFHSQVSPLLSVKWGQNYPEGELCPNGLSGCTNTALAQVMSYYSFPTSIPITYDDSNSNLTLNWIAMKEHSYHNSGTTCNNPSAHTQISKLLRQLGHLNQSEYYYNMTSTSVWPLFQTYPLYHTIKDSLGYEGVTMTNYNDEYVRNQLSSGHLLLISGGAQTNGNNRHTWVLDGYRYDDVLIYVYMKIGNDKWHLSETIEYVNNYMHFNWGWNGQNNGYFDSGVFNTFNGSYDDPTLSNSIPADLKYSVVLINVYH